MEYFCLYNHCFFKAGAKKSAIFDIFSRRVFHIELQWEQDFLKLSRNGRSLCDISRELSIGEELVSGYAKYLELLDFGAIYGKMKLSSKFQPFTGTTFRNKMGLYQPVSRVTLEMSSSCSRNCELCRPESRVATLECVCGRFSKTPAVAYDIGETIRRLSFALPSFIELAGGEPYTNRNDIEQVIKCASEYEIPVRVKTPPALLEPDDLALLKESGAALSIILTDFIPDKRECDLPMLTRILSEAAHMGYFNIDISLSYDSRAASSGDIMKARVWLKECELTLSSLSVAFPCSIREMSEYSRLEHASAYLPSRHNNFAIDTDEMSRRLNGDPCWQDGICIMANGDVRPCIASEGIVFGNVKENHVLDIIRTARTNHPDLFWPKDDGTCARCEFALGCFTCHVSAEKIGSTHGRRVWSCPYDPFKGEFFRADVAAEPPPH